MFYRLQVYSKVNLVGQNEPQFCMRYKTVGSVRRGFPGGTNGKEPACQCRKCRRNRFDPWVGKIPPEEGMATRSSILCWRIPCTEEPGGLQSMGSQTVRHDWARAHTHIHTHTHTRTRAHTHRDGVPLHHMQMYWVQHHNTEFKIRNTEERKPWRVKNHWTGCKKTRGGF